MTNARDGEGNSQVLRACQQKMSGLGGEGMVAGASDAQHRDFNEFPLSGQSESWAARENKPLLQQRRRISIIRPRVCNSVG